MLLVRKVEGPATARVGERVIYRATKFNRVNPTLNEKRGINWLIKCDGEDFRRGHNAGDVFSLEITETLAGKTIVAMPFARKPTPAVSVVTLIQSEPEQELRRQWGALRDEFADVLIENIEELSERELAGKIQNLAEKLDDLLDASGPVDEDREGDIEPEIPPIDARRLAIVVGHTQERQGAVALAPISQNEYPFNKRIAQLMELEAADRGVLAKTFLRDGIGIEGAYRASVAFEPDSIIELHFNSFDNPAVRGTETLYAEVNPGSKRLAKIVQESMVSIFSRSGRSNRGIKLRGPGQRGFTSLSSAPSVPSVLVEPFFASNLGECQLVKRLVNVVLGFGNMIFSYLGLYLTQYVV